MAEWKSALERLNDPSFQVRAKRCEAIGEFGFALLLQFVPLESAIKLVIYYSDPDAGWPRNLDLRGKAELFRSLRELNHEKYEISIIQGQKSVKPKTLRQARNLVAHECYNPNENDYHYFSKHAEWAISHISELLPKGTLSDLDQTKRRKQNDTRLGLPRR